MAVAKTKAPPEAEVVEEETPETEATIKKSDLVDTIKEVLKDVLPGKGEESEAEVEEKVEPKKRPSLRDEEETMRSMVAEKVAEFLKKAPEEESKDDKPVVETVPATSVGRKIEKWIWGKE